MNGIRYLYIATGYKREYRIGVFKQCSVQLFTMFHLNVALELPFIESIGLIDPDLVLGLVFNTIIHMLKVLIVSPPKKLKHSTTDHFENP
jgi:hypothetical protein